MSCNTRPACVCMSVPVCVNLAGAALLSQWIIKLCDQDQKKDCQIEELD